MPGAERLEPEHILLPLNSNNYLLIHTYPAVLLSAHSPSPCNLTGCSMRVRTLHYAAQHSGS